MTEIDRIAQEVASSPSSIFTKDDVLALLDRARTAGPGMSADDLVSLVEDMGETIDPTELVMMDTAEFYIDGDRVVLDSVSVDTDGLARMLRNLIEDINEDPERSPSAGNGVAFTVKAKKRRKRK